LERFNYLSDKCKELKLIIETNFEVVEKWALHEGEVKIQEYSEQIGKRFFSLRNEIDLKRETVLEIIHKADEEPNAEEIKEIHRQSSNLIEQLDLTENEFRRKFMHEIESFVDEINIDEHRQHLCEMLRSIYLSEKEMENFKKKIEAKIKKIKKDFAQIDRKFVFSLKRNQFKEPVNGGLSKNFVKETSKRYKFIYV
jgi:hypothetical protein